MIRGETFGAALRRLRHERGMSSLRQFAESLHYSAAYISEIERGIKRPTPEVAQKCDDALGARGLLVAQADVERLGPRELHTFAEPAPRQSPPPGGVEQPLTTQEIVIKAAHESTTGAVDDGSQSVHEMSVEQVQYDARRLARSFNDTPPLETLIAARQLRQTARRMAEQTNRPHQAGDLYQVAGLACGIMSVASFDLAIWPAAIEQARAALVYGDLVDDVALQAWAHGSLALTAYWTRGPARGRGLRRAWPAPGAAGNRTCTPVMHLRAGMVLPRRRGADTCRH